MEVQGMKALFRARFALPIIILCAFASESAAQQLSLSGTVRDNAGVIPGATVVLNSAGAQVAMATTDESGSYRFTGLTAGTFELMFSMRGFETLVRTVTLTSDTPVVDVVLSVGRVSTSLTVTASGGKATATRLPVANDEVPAQVSSIPQELIRQQGFNSVGEALQNASGVQAVRWYGAYEQYTIRGFSDPDRDSFNVVLLDGMRLGGNRYATQTNNIQSVEVLKGPSSVLYGRGAVGGTINIIRKKPQAVRAYDFSYRGGRFNTHQIAGGATGAVASSDKFLYRLDSSVEHSDGWRDAGADRFNLSPSLTWLMSNTARLTVHQTFNRDRFDGDGGVPLNIITLPSFEPDLRFSLPQDRVLVEDSQTQVIFNGNLSPKWEFRNSLMIQRTSDKYFVTEGVYGDPEANEVFREPLDFHHIRRPIQNQSEVIGRLGGHNLLFGYEYQRDKYRTEVTAGDDPDCLCGYWWLTIAPMNISTMEETQTPLDIETIERTTFVNDNIHSIYGQDQIDLAPKVKVNIAGRVDNYSRNVDRVGGTPFTPIDREQTAYTYRAGIVYAPRFDQQLYFATSSSFTPVNTVPPDGSNLDPSTARNYEIGHRWQGWNGRVDTSLAVYHITRNNVTVQETVTTFRQIGEQTSKGLDVDINTDLGSGTYLIFNYGFATPRYEDADDLSGLRPRFVPRNLVNLWVRKDFRRGFNAAFGARFVGEQFVNDSNSVHLDAYTIFSGAIGYRTDRWEWTLNAENLFNKTDYFLPGHFSNNAFPGQPINVNSTIRFKFN
jgi:iron complex outermembrane recepter protein